MERPYVWQMIRMAVEALGGHAQYQDIKKYIRERWPDVNESTINAQIIVLTVNQPSRIHYPENKKARLSTGNYDLLYTVGRGEVVRYNPEEHGMWEIFHNEFGAPGVRQVIEEDNYTEELEEDKNPFLFPLESNLRDFLIKNLHTVKGKKLKLFVDETGREGKEYQAGRIGFIDILAIDDAGDFTVFELKLSKGPDRALGQLLRYMGWVKHTLADGKKVLGVIIANKMDEKIRYAVSMVPDVSLYEYEMKFELTSPPSIGL